MNNTWPDGVRRPISQKEHEEWNSSNYPGTKQLCQVCDTPTGRCEEDSLYRDDSGPLCNFCYAQNY